MSRTVHAIMYHDPRAKVWIMMCGRLIFNSGALRASVDLDSGLIIRHTDFVNPYAHTHLRHRVTCEVCKNFMAVQVIRHPQKGYLKLISAEQGVVGEFTDDIDHATTFPNAYAAFHYIRLAPPGAEITPL